MLKSAPSPRNGEPYVTLGDLSHIPESWHIHVCNLGLVQMPNFAWAEAYALNYLVIWNG